jgi:hypothetical protein
VNNIVSLNMAGGVRPLRVDSIRSVTREVDSQLWTAAGYGAVIGVANYRTSESFLAGREGATAGLEGALIGGIGGFTAGLLVGAALSAEEKYEFAGLSTARGDSLLREIRRDMWSSSRSGTNNDHVRKA